MIEAIFNLDLTEETNDTKDLRKTFSGLQVSSGRAFRRGRGGGTLVTYFTVLHRQNCT